MNINLAIILLIFDILIRRYISFMKSEKVNNDKHLATTYLDNKYKLYITNIFQSISYIWIFFGLYLLMHFFEKTNTIAIIYIVVYYVVNLIQFLVLCASYTEAIPKVCGKHLFSLKPTFAKIVKNLSPSGNSLTDSGK